MTNEIRVSVCLPSVSQLHFPCAHIMMLRSCQLQRAHFRHTLSPSGSFLVKQFSGLAAQRAGARARLRRRQEEGDQHPRHRHHQPRYPFRLATSSHLSPTTASFHTPVLYVVFRPPLIAPSLSHTHSLSLARSLSLPLALFFFLPGNPTGQCLTVESMREIVDFCYRKSLVLMADEVYQTNIYSSTPFTSFRKVVLEMVRVILDGFHRVLWHRPSGVPLPFEMAMCVLCFSRESVF